jgi:succinate dehydrogenase / fumarate reductase cytochrome b subunit
MGWARRTFTSSIGLKWLMAVSGIALVLFVVAHMAGNLLVFLGPDAINEYAVGLREMPLQLLWVARAGLGVAFLVHVFTGVRLTNANRDARPERYQVKKAVASTLASRHMMLGGLFLLAFVLYHLAHFTFHGTNPQFADLRDAQDRHDVYTMMVLGFTSPIVSALYVAAMIPLCLHLSHGVSSAFQSLGLSDPKLSGLVRALGPFVATVIFVGNVSMPVAVLAGALRLPPGAG